LQGNSATSFGKATGKGGKSRCKNYLCQISSNNTQVMHMYNILFLWRNVWFGCLGTWYNISDTYCRTVLYVCSSDIS